LILNEKALDRGGSSFVPATDITSIVDSLYSSLYRFALGLTRSESDAADPVEQTSHFYALVHFPCDFQAWKKVSFPQKKRIRVR
jgi:hypothetical protein